MKIMKWAVPFIVVLAMALCLKAEKGPNVGKLSIPPGINKADWHLLSDELGYVLQVTEESRPVARSSEFEKEIAKIKTEIDEILKEMKVATSKEELELAKQKFKQKREELKQLQKMQDAYSKKMAYAVGEAHIYFFARNGEKWYAITTPSRPFGLQFIQQ